MKKKAKEVLFDSNGDMYALSRPYRWDNQPLHKIPIETELKLNLKFEYEENGWLLFRSDDNVQFRLAPSEIKNLIDNAIIKRGKVKGVFGFTNKGTSQSIKFLREY